jgi:hypothetical protein
MWCHRFPTTVFLESEQRPCPEILSGPLCAPTGQQAAYREGTDIRESTQFFTVAAISTPLGLPSQFPCSIEGQLGRAAEAVPVTSSNRRSKGLARYFNTIPKAFAPNEDISASARIRA